MTRTDVPADAQRPAPKAYALEITESRESRVAAIGVRRALPQRGRRTVGNEQVIVAGHLNMMTAGWDVPHSEEGHSSRDVFAGSVPSRP